MSRKVRDANLETRSARARLKAAHKPYYRLIEPGLHLGYRKNASGPGAWVVRRYNGGTYAVTNLRHDGDALIVADDFSEADGHVVLTFAQAQERAKAHRPAERQAKGPLIVADAMDSYLEFLAHNRRSAHDARSRDRLYIRPALGAVEIGKLTADRLRKWHTGMAQAARAVRTAPGRAQQHRPIGPGDDGRRARRASANRTLTTLKGALNRAWRDGHVESDKAWRSVEPFEGVDAARVRYLQVPEAKRLINGCEPKFRNLVQAALQTGARYGELAALRVHDFNADSGTLAIRQSKSGNPRHVVLTDEGARFFNGIVTGRDGTAPMLAKPSGEPWRASDQKRPMIAACERGHIKPAVGFHALRHTWASLAVMNGVPLLVVAKNLGHSDTRMVEKHYGHLAPSYVAEAIRAGAPRFGTVPATNIRQMGQRTRGGVQ